MKANKSGPVPIKLNSEQIKEMERMAPFATTEQIADALGISRRVFFNILRRDEENYALYKKARARGLNFASSKLMQGIKKGDNAATIFYLKTQWGWSEKPIKTIDTSDFNIQLKTPEDLSLAMSKLIEQVMVVGGLEIDQAYNLIKIINGIKFTEQFGKQNEQLKKLTDEQVKTFMGWIEEAEKNT